MVTTLGYDILCQKRLLLCQVAALYVQNILESSDNSLNCSSVLWKKSWLYPLILRILLWAWQAFKHRLPTNVNLIKRGVLLPSFCSFCHDASETFLHICYDCYFAKQFWAFASTKHVLINGSATLLSHWLLQKFGLPALCMEISACWFLRRKRNERLFQNINKSIAELWR